VIIPNRPRRPVGCGRSRCHRRTRRGWHRSRIAGGEPWSAWRPLGLLRRRDVPARTDRQSLRSESVTYVPGM